MPLEDEMSGHGQSDDDKVFQALKATRQFFESEQPASNLDEAFEQLRQRVLDISEPVQKPVSLAGRVRAKVLHMFGRSEGIEGMIAWLRGTGRFEESKLKLVRRAKVLIEDENGHVFVRKQGLAIEIALMGLVSISFMLGFWVCWLISSNGSSLAEIGWSYCIGTIAGAIIGRLLDRSVKFEKIQKEVLVVAPWLAEPVKC
jgi:hypothetical protein